MIRIRPEEIEKEDDDAFSGTEEQDVMFLLVPVRTYKRCAERANIEGCTAAQVFERALLQYLREDKSEMDDSQVNGEKSNGLTGPEPDIVIRRTRK